MYACSGPPHEPAGETIRDGKLQTWLQIPGEEPLLVVDEQNMGWRVYNNVSIDTLYFSVFFGGSSAKFEASKDEVRHLHLIAPGTHEHRKLPQLATKPTACCAADNLVRRHPSVGGPLRARERAFLPVRCQALA